MKYLLIKRSRYSIDYDVTEFATQAELAAHLVQHGAKDVIVAQRLNVNVQLGEWTAPPAEAVPDAEELAA